MDNINNFNISDNISDLAKEVIERYVGKKDYVVRIRIDKKNKEKNNLEINVYYDGRKSFDVIGKKLILDGAYFFSKGNKKFSSPIKTEIDCLKTLGFSFKMGTELNSTNAYRKDGYKYRIFVEASSAEIGSKGYYDNHKEEIKERMAIILDALKKYDEGFIHVYDDETKINNFYTKNDTSDINYFELAELLNIGINNTVPQQGIKKINFNEKMVGTERTYTEVEYRIIDAIMEDRIKSYNFGLASDEEDRNEYDDKSEKTYQQLLMNKMFDKKEREELLAVDNCPFKDSYAYEMEYNLYAANRTKRSQRTKKGRVDNIFINRNKILFTELKYNENVIGGTNGIHKHLIDLINGFEKNNEALSEIYDYVCDYNDVLSRINGKEEYLIKDVKRFDEKEIEKEFIIICGYSNGNRNNVLNELNRVFLLTGKAAGIEKKYEFNIENKTINLENLTGEELVSMLKDRYNCETKIYLVDDNYTKFETYKSDSLPNNVGEQ